MSTQLSYAALIMSALSLAISWHFGYRDRARLNISARFHAYHPEYDRGHISIKVVNQGRRPTILTMFGGDLNRTGWVGTHLTDKKSTERSQGIRLGEHEMYETKVYFHDVEHVDPEGNQDEYVNFWFEDTIGRRFKVPHSENLIVQLKEDFHKNSNE